MCEGAPIKTRLILSAFAFVAACSPTTPPAPDYEAEAQRAIAAFDSTGMILGVMIDGETVYTGAFGKASEATGAPVTTDTLFPIASISKAFTTTALAILADRGELDWNDPVRKHIPEFAMYDDWVTEHFTIKDALTHRSGLPLGAGDLLIWPDSAATVDDIIAALPHLPPSAGFRDEYAYDNLLYIVAGEIVHRVSGKSWADFVTNEIFQPVGLDNCAPDAALVRPGLKVVTGHERAAGADTGVPVAETGALSGGFAAAGGIHCPVADMLTWAKFWLDGATTASGERLFSEDQFRKLWTGVTPVPISPSSVFGKSGLVHEQLYALGWFVQDFDGRLMLSHSGGYPGVVSNFVLLPDENIAIFASSNDYRAASHAITYQLADDLIGQRSFDVIAAYSEGFAKSIEGALAASADAVSPPEDAAAPTLPLDAYAGVYRDAWYGDVTITYDGDKLFLDMSRSQILDAPLSLYNGDTFAAFWPDRSLKADAFVTFEVENGQAVGFKMKAISDITDFSYDFHDLDLKRVEPN